MDANTSAQDQGVSESGTGVPPVSEIKKRRGAYLPHWTREGAWYGVTFRLWDSLPRRVVESWLFERKNIVKTAEQMKRPLSAKSSDWHTYIPKRSNAISTRDTVPAS